MDDPYNMMINRTRDKKILPQIDPAQVDIEIIAIGKKGQDALAKSKKNLIASFNGLNDLAQINDLSPVVKIIIDGYTKKKYDKVIIAYTDFISTMLNKPRLRQVLPISRKDLERQLEELGGGISEKEEMEEVKAEVQKRQYTFEPGKEALLNVILPNVVESQIYQAFLESQASEYSARMITMKNATDTAGDMIYSFTLQYNQARQAAITSELAEISGGMVALED
jgi:F-type H+-transporting ATPase subunit gamma